MKKEISLVVSKCITHLVNGVGWLMYGVLSIFDNSICSLIASVFLLGCIILNITVPFSSNENDDEMSKHNMMKAKATTMDLLKIIICIILLIITIIGLVHEFFPSVNDNIHISLGMIVPLMLGITEIMIGFLFVKYEKDGE